MQERDWRLSLYNDFTLYAKHNLKIRPKEGTIKPFLLNKAQLYIHDKLEEQKRKTGRVRALILKGRQQGCSTYVSARFYHQVTHNKGLKVFILTHKESATETLYNLVKRFHDNCKSELKPSVGMSNAKSLLFDRLDSGYSVGTSGSGEVGRSDTIQLLHGSEVAFWQNTDKLSSGIMQTVPDMKNTEIILESTANGVGNMFHKLCIGALNDENGYQLIFTPWFWQDEYRAEPEEGFSLSEEEKEYKGLYKLDDAQILWRRKKIKVFDGGSWQFRQEYPATAIEAFQTSSDNSYIQPESVLRARKAKDVFKGEQLIVGVDPAWRGSDKTAIVFRAGRVQFRHETYSKMSTMEVAGRVVKIINHYKPEKVFIDVGGIGAGIYDRLIELGYKGVVVSVNFGGKADDGERYKNKRAEMWARIGKWLDDGPVKIEDIDSLHADLISSEFLFDSNNRLQLEKKEEHKKRLGRSPDLGDALALTFAFMVPNKEFQKKFGIGSVVVTNNNWNVYG